MFDVTATSETPRARPTARTVRLLVGTLLLATVGTALYAAGVFKPKLNPNEIVRKGLVVSADELNLGEIYYTDSIEHTFTVKNPTNKPIEIESWSTSCNCSVVEPKQLTVPARGAAVVKGIIYLPSDLKNTNVKDSQALAVIYVPEVRGQGERKTMRKAGWKVSANILPLIIGSKLIDHGQHSFLSQPIKPKTVDLSLSDGLIVESITCIDDCIKAKIVNNTFGRCKLLFSPSNQLEKKDYDARFIVHLKNTLNEQTFSALITDRLSIVSDIASTPAYSRLPICKIGEEQIETITLSSLTGRNVVIESVTFIGVSDNVDVIHDNTYVHVRVLYNHPGNNFGFLLVDVVSENIAYSQTIILDWYCVQN